ncbi:hypothetical protein [Deferrisoma sp.]
MAISERRRQKALEKRRKEREEKRRRERQRRLSARAETATGRLLARAGDLPIEECVISRGWRERGKAHILVARRMENGRLLVGGYYVDLWCLGLKDTAVLPNLDPEDYRTNIKPEIFHDKVEFEPCEPGLALAVIEAAIEFAGTLGFRPDKRWPESARLFAGVEPSPEPIETGRNGKPCLVIKPGENLMGPRRRLERLLEPGAYEIVEEGE